MEAPKKYWKANTLTEAKLIVSLLSAEFENLWKPYHYIKSVGHFISVREKGRIKYGGDIAAGYELSTMEELFELAKNGFKEAKWTPNNSEDFFIADPTACELANSDSWYGAYGQQRQRDRGLIFKTEEEAAAAAEKMLAALNDSED